MNPFLLAMLAQVLGGHTARGIPQGQGPKGVAQGRHGDRGPMAAAQSQRNQRRLQGQPMGPRAQQAQPQPMAAPNPMMLQLLKGLMQPKPQSSEGPILSALKNSPLMRAADTLPKPPVRPRNATRTTSVVPQPASRADASRGR